MDFPPATLADFRQAKEKTLGIFLIEKNALPTIATSHHMISQHQHIQSVTDGPCRENTENLKKLNEKCSIPRTDPNGTALSTISLKYQGCRKIGLFFSAFILVVI
jgi:hypothetical protein